MTYFHIFVQNLFIITNTFHKEYFKSHLLHEMVIDFFPNRWGGMCAIQNLQDKMKKLR